MATQEAFCESSIWNWTLVWNKESPDLPSCFQDVFLVCLPCILLWILSPPYVFYVIKNHSQAIPPSKLFKRKMRWSAVLGLSAMASAVFQLAGHVHLGQSVVKSDVMASLLLLATVAASCVITAVERQHGRLTSGFQFCFWLLMSVNGVISLYSLILHEVHVHSPTLFCELLVRHLATGVLFFLHCFAEASPMTSYSVSSKKCGEPEASIPSLLSFWWMNSLISEGYKVPLTEATVHDLHPQQTASTVVPPFLRQWNREQQQISKDMARKPKFISRRQKDSQSHKLGEYFQLQPSDVDVWKHETTPSHHDETTDDEDCARLKKRREEHEERGRVGLLKVLWKTYGKELMCLQTYQMVHNVFLLSTPLLVGLLVGFIQDPAAPGWRGGLLCLGLFVGSLVQSLMDKQSYHQCGCLGIRIRTAVLSAVYRKTLRLDVTSRQEKTSGEIVNLVSIDCEQLQIFITNVYELWSAPLQLVVCILLLYGLLGMPALVGAGLMVLTVPVNLFILRKHRECVERRRKLQDSRLKILSEVLSGIKVLKMYAWEKSFIRKIEDVRQREVAVFLLDGVWDTFLHFSWTVLPYIISLVIFVTYIYTNEDHYLRPQTAFVTLTFMNLIRFAINTAPPLLNRLIKFMVSIGRLESYLNQPEMETDHVMEESSMSLADHENLVAVSVHKASFSWNLDLGTCLKDVTLSVGQGSLVAVVGTVGSGKTSLLSAVLGEMHRLRGTVSMRGSVAYVPQQAWILHDSLRNNVLFGKPMSQDFYEHCLNACALRPDLDLLPGHDLTEIGEKGINLSGGQKQRVSLARAVYSDADIHLLDDPLSAVDAHVGRDLFTRVIGHSGLLAGKTRILVTHGVQWLPHVDVIVMMKEGRLVETGTLDELISLKGHFASYLDACLSQDSKDDNDDAKVQSLKRQLFHRLHSDPCESKPNQKLPPNYSDSIMTSGRSIDVDSDADSDVSESSGEERRKRVEKNLEENKHLLVEEEGVEVKEVSWVVYKSLLQAVGYVFSLLIVIVFALYHVALVTSDVYLSRWTDDRRLTNLTALPPDSALRWSLNRHYLSLYAGFGVMQTVMMLAYKILQKWRIIHACRTLHRRMLSRVLRAPMSFYDVTPMGRVMSRFSGDVNTVDTELHYSTSGMVESSCQLISAVFVISYTTPWFLLAAAPIFVLYIFVQRYYISSNRQLNRLSSKSQSPLYSCLTETVCGLGVIRAHAAQPRFIQLLQDRLDANTKFRFYSYAANRWVGIRLDFLGALVVLVTSLTVVALRHNMSPGVVGLGITYALNITQVLYFFVMSIGDLEMDVVSLERIAQMSSIDQEAPWEIPRYKPPSIWPGTGQVKVNNLDLRYRKGLELVLHGVTISVQGGEKIGIVGRTGAGKSSLALALFRLMELSRGQVHIDDLDIAPIGLHDLRSRLAVLPQDPVIFAGSIRSNLDPFDEFKDAEVWSALKHAHLEAFVAALPMRLGYDCGQGGENLSMGQRQLLCLARTLLRNSRILVLDEATAAVDMETDEVIQKTLRSEFADCTVLTIAHRLHTIMDYDKILVLEQGKVAAYDTPRKLLERPNNAFYHMVNSAGLLPTATNKHHHHHHHLPRHKR